MVIIKLPDDLQSLSSITCVICSKTIVLEEATAGLWDVDNQQAFACNGHFWNGSEYIVGWVDFIIAQRQKLQSRNNNIWGGEADAGQTNLRLV
jgi:hypothetical protein